MEQLLTQEIQKHIKATIIKGKVKDLKENHCTVSPLDGSPDIFKVQYQSVIRNEKIGLLIIPEEQSDVLVGFINNNENDAFIVQYSDIKEFHLSTGEQYIEMDADGIYFSGNTQSIVRGDELKKELEIEKARLTALINAIKTAVVVPSDGGAAFKLNISTALASVQQGSYSDILSDKVKTA